ncbi:MAG: hypothetical protein QOI41_3391 [Myxococcales bacterium]|nr:hypothetical protein [Myxococcales bacterium]
MRRRPARYSLFFAAIAVVSGGAAYGCGGAGSSIDDGTDTGVPPDDAHDGSLDTSSAPDGELLLDGARAPDAEGGAIADASSDGDADSDGAIHDAAAEADADAAPPPPPPPPPGPLSTDYVDYDINHVLETGQSNSVANGGRPDNTVPINTVPYTTTQPYTNLMFNTGVMTAQSCDGNGCPAANYVAPTSFVPLVEQDQFFSGSKVETASSALANEVSNLALTTFMFNVKAGYPTKHDVLVSLHGRSGNTYWCLRKGGCSYKPANEIKAFDEATAQVTAAKALAAAAVPPKSYVVRAVTAIHGESDHYAYQQNADNHPEFPLVGTNGVANRIQEYDDALIEWQEDYEAMAKSITGQTQPVPLFISGVSGWTGNRHSKLSLLQMSAHLRAPGKVVYVAPGYVFEGAVPSTFPVNGALECLHFSIHGQQHLGEYFAKAYAQVVFKGQPWEPLRPIDIQRAGAVITVKLLVPVPPIALDTTRVAMIGNYGFDFSEGGVDQAISKVEVTAADTVTITLAAVPGAGVKRLTYAVNQPTPNGCIGPGVVSAGGARGNLRDSDATPSVHGYSLYNWEVPFDMAVP